jgi:hypothetical protein
MLAVEAFLAIVMPFAVKYTTQFAKQLNGIPSSEHRIAIIRAIVLVLSLTGALLTQMIGEGKVDPTLVETTVYGVANAGFATWLYLTQKNK